VNTFFQQLRQFGIWLNANLKVAIIVIVTILVLLILIRVASPLALFSSVREWLHNRIGMDYGPSTFFAIMIIGGILAVQGFVGAYLFLGRAPHKAGLAIIGVATVFLVISLTAPAFSRDGKTKPYAYVAPDGRIKLSDAPGLSPSGVPMVAATHELLAREELQRRGIKPQRISKQICKLDYFDTVSGKPLVYFTHGPDGRVILWDAPGLDPFTTEQMQPVTPEIVRVWVRQYGC
jgi:hypothetical protein